MSEPFFPQILENAFLKARLEKDVAEGSLSHAYVLEGQKGSGRHTVALSTVAAVACREGKASGAVPCLRCPSCRKIMEGKSPDVKVIGLEDDKATVGVEAVRLLKNDLVTAPTELPYKVYILEDADCLTVQAQNAFLLSLEEPPPYVLFFLICENSGNLLETVRSRAPILRTERIEDDVLESTLLRKEKRAVELRNDSPEDWNQLLVVSAGSIGRGIELLDTRRRKQIFEYRASAKQMVSLLGSSRRADAFEAINSLGTKRQDILIRLTHLRYALRDLILLKKSENAPLCFYEDREIAAELSTRFTAQGLFQLYEAINTATDDLEMNSNVRLTLTRMMSSAGLI